jgi:hypothetical protein
MARRVLCNRRSFLTTNVLFQSPVPITATETVFANSASANVTLPTPVNLAMNVSQFCVQMQNKKPFTKIS